MLRPHAFFVVLLTATAGLLAGCQSPPPAASVRVATFNTALSRQAPGRLHAALSRRDDPQARLVAEVLQRTRPDIVLLQEVDEDPSGQAYADFQANYLRVSQNGAEPIAYGYTYAPQVNTGVLAPVDLDRDGRITRPSDCYGHGLFEGHYGMLVMSRFPIDAKAVGSFREALWKDMPGHCMPRYFFSQDAADHTRLSSKTHALVPVRLPTGTIDLLISHPTPPVFDGAEDRNGRRNYDEIGAWARYLNFTNPADPPADAPVLFPLNDGTTRTLYQPSDHLFVLLGDLNADPNDGASRPGAARQLLQHPRIQGGIEPLSAGGLEASFYQGGKNLGHRTYAAADTADFADGERGPGNLRVDYVLPSVGLQITGCGVYWPTRDDPRAYLNDASDHKLVWIDIALGAE